jgi:SAM-dependent methyltransferase
VLDLGCGDGDLSFFFESLGCRVYAVDNPSSNFNRMLGVKALKAALQSPVQIDSADLDAGFEFPVDHCGLAIFLGVLYHLKNPFGVLESLSARARYCLLSTAITRYGPDQRTDVGSFPVAFLAGRDGLRGDETNYWIFSEAGLRVLLERTGWEVRDWLAAGDTDSVLWGTQRDERVFCLLASRVLPPSGSPQLCGGWHVMENDAWRWTEQRFSVAVGEGARRLTLRCAVPESVTVPVTLSARRGSAVVGTHTFTSHGESDCVMDLANGEGDMVELELDHALRPDANDLRERGIVVRDVEVG